VLKSKRCCSCHRTKSLRCFGLRSESPDYARSECRCCANNYRKRWYGRKGRDQNLRLRYGLTLIAKEKLEKEQNYLCAICRKASTKTLNVDHNHTTGKVRGLLCHNCNRGIGYLHDSSEIILNAYHYLTKEKP